LDSREYDSLFNYLPHNQSPEWGLVFSFYIYLELNAFNMDEKETVKADKMCSQALTYFYIMSQIRNREYSIEMLCSKGHITPWTLGQDNWAKFVPFPLDDLDIMN
jgi:CRISPR/Cas system-associated endonuclease/helicase Cas3